MSTGLDLFVKDVSQQKALKLSRVPEDSTVGELVSSVVGELSLPPNDSSGNPVAYAARLEREGRQLHAAERVGDACKTEDQLTIQPNIDAG